MITINDLQAKEATLYRSYVKANSLDGSQQKAIDSYLSEGKQGHAKIISIVDLMKANNESTAKIKVQVARGMKKLGFTLTLQGLGKDDVTTIAEKSTSNLPKEGVIVSTKAPKPEDSVKADNKSITTEQAWDFVEKYYTLDEVQKLLKAVKSRIKDDEKQAEVVKNFKVA